MKTFLASYNYNGGRWNLQFQAESQDDAEARLKRMAWGEVDGELIATIPAYPGVGVMLPLVVRLRNWLRGRR